MRSPYPVSSDTVSCVLQAAQEVFCTAGYRASIDAVATRAGVARQTIYNNFGNKQKLFSRAIEHGMASFWADIMPTGTTITEQLHCFGIRFRAHVLNPEMARLHCMLTSEALRFPEQARDFFEKAHMGTRHGIAALLSEAMARGQLRQDDALEAAHFFIDGLIGVDLDRLLYAGEIPDPAQEAARVQRHVERFLRAYAPETIQ